jgi:hypothetical protein
MTFANGTGILDAELPSRDGNHHEIVGVSLVNAQKMTL